MTTNSVSPVVSEIKRCLKIAWPIMGAQFLVLSMFFVDNIMVGQIGADSLGALAVANSLFSFVSIVAIGAIGALTPFYAEAIGAKQYQQLLDCLRQSWFYVFLLILVVEVLLFFSQDFLLAMGQDERLIPVALSYIQIIMFGLPALLVQISLRYFCESHGDSLPSIIIIAVVAALNIPLDYLLVFGFGPIPSLGVRGAAMATTLLQWVALLLTVLYIWKSQKYREYVFLKKFNPDWDMIREFVRVGFPLGAAIAVEVWFFVATTFLMGKMGTRELAAHQVALNAASIIFMIPLGLSHGLAILMGQNIGNKRFDLLKSSWQAGLIITLVIQTITAMLFLFAPRFVVDLYGQSGAVASLAVELVMIAGFFQLFDGMQVIGIGGLRGLKETRFAMFATILAFWVIGAIFVYIQFQQKSPAGIWYGLLISLGIAAAMHHFRIYTRVKALSLKI